MRVWMPVRLMPAHEVGGGMERVAATVAAGLADRGHEVCVVTTSHPAGLEEDHEGDIRVLYLPGSTWRRYTRQWWEASYQVLRQEHRAAGYSVILSHSAGGLGYLSRARRELGLASIVLFHGSARGELRGAWRAAASPRGLYRLGRLGLRLPRQHLQWRREAGAVHQWMAVSEAVAAENGRQLRLRPEQLTVAPVGVSTEAFRPDPVARASVRHALGIPGAAPVVVLVGRLEREKGVQVALDAAHRLRSRHPDLRLVVAGHGHHRRALERQAGALGLADRCSFLGLVEHDEVPALLAAADVFAFPSLLAEARPVSVLEASASGVPVVATRSAGVAGVVVDGRTGLLTRRGDASDLATAVSRLLADEPARREMGRLGREAVKTGWSVAAMLDAVEQALKATVSGRDPAAGQCGAGGR